MKVFGRRFQGAGTALVGQETLAYFSGVKRTFTASDDVVQLRGLRRYGQKGAPAESIACPNRNPRVSHLYLLCSPRFKATSNPVQPAASPALTVAESLTGKLWG